jgi:hypothetical protein
VTVELKIDLLEAALRRGFDGVLFAVDLDRVCAVNEGLTPDADQDLFKFWHGSLRRSA